MSRLTEEELLFELTSQIGDLAPYYADRFAQRAKKEVLMLLKNLKKIKFIMEK